MMMMIRKTEQRLSIPLRFAGVYAVWVDFCSVRFILQIDETCDEAAEHIANAYPDSRLSKPIAISIHKLWGDEGIQATYENRAEFQV
jgi:hypothetical protein